MSDEIRMLTYVEAGRILGIKPESVTRRARNRRWKREMGNDGLMRVGVPLSVIPQDVTPEILPDVSPDVSPDIRRDDPAMLVRIASLETEVRMLRETLTDLRQDRDAWREQAQARRRWWPWSNRRQRT